VAEVAPAMVQWFLAAGKTSFSFLMP